MESKKRVYKCTKCPLINCKLVMEYEAGYHYIPDYCPHFGHNCAEFEQNVGDIEDTNYWHELYINRKNRQLEEVRDLIKEVEKHYEELLKEKEETKKLLDSLRNKNEKR